MYYLVQFAEAIGKITAQLTLSDMLEFNKWIEQPPSEPKPKKIPCGVCLQSSAERGPAIIDDGEEDARSNSPPQGSNIPERKFRRGVE